MKNALIGLLALISLVGCQSLTTRNTPAAYTDISQTAPHSTDGKLEAMSANYDRWAEQHWLQPFGGVAKTN